jgi:protein TonB
MFHNYESKPGLRSRSVSLTGSAAIHSCVLLVLMMVRFTVDPRPHRYTETRLYVPLAEPAKAAPRQRETPALRFVPPPSSAPLTVPQPSVALLPLPEPPAARAAVVPAQRPVLPIPAAAAVSRPSPGFVSALPATLSTSRVTPRDTGSFPAVPVKAAPAAARLQLAESQFGAVPLDTSHRGSASGATLPAGFGTAGVTAASRRSGTSTGASNGFAGIAVAAPAPAPAARPATAGTAFAAAVTADPGRPTAVRQSGGEPLEILYKPRPEYTEEARRARAEGDVVLEVLFTGSGTLRVLRVVRGLGYGLEQNATDAAAKIRFRPAREDGHAIDTVATVRITFQMAY